MSANLTTYDIVVTPLHSVLGVTTYEVKFADIKFVCTFVLS